MRVEEVTGNSGNYVQCFTCRDAPILPVMGDKNSDLKVRLEGTATHHEQRHRDHDVVIYLKVEAELPIVRDMRERLANGL